jgi:hypothetical protein
VDRAACGRAATIGTSMAMVAPHANGFGEGWAGMAEGSEKQERSV